MKECDFTPRIVIVPRINVWFSALNVIRCNSYHSAESIFSQLLLCHHPLSQSRNEIELLFWPFLAVELLHSFDLWPN